MRKFFLWFALNVLLFASVTGQWSSWSGQNPITGDRTFWMDSTSQCSQKVFEVGKNTVTVYGREAVQANPGSLTECQLTLSSDSVGERRRFQVEIVVGIIREQNVHFTMYDGPDTGSNRIFAISKGSAVDTSRKYDTSGGYVTFYLIKGSPADTDFNIQLRVIVVPDIGGPSDECKTGNEYGCIDAGLYKTPIEKDVVIGIVGGIFGLILFIVIPIIVICCYRKSRGVNRRWDEFKLHDTPNTAADIHNSNTSLTKSKKELWTSQSSRIPYPGSRKTRSRYSDGGESEFSEVSDLPPKHRPPPPPYDEYDRGFSYRDGPRGYRNGRDDRYQNGQYDDRVDRDHRADRNYRTRYDSDKRSFHSSSDGSFVQGRDDHPQDVFIERVIEPRVKPPTKAEQQQRAKYQEDDDDPYDKIVEDSPKFKPKVKPKAQVKESAMQCEEEESSDDNESNTESDNEPPSTDETDDEDIIKKKEAEAKKAAMYAKPKKKPRKEKTTEQLPVSTQPGSMVYPMPPGSVQMVPGQPVFYNTQQLNGPRIFPRPVPPVQQPYFHQPPHARPIMSSSALPPPQPGMLQGYQQPTMSSRLPPPSQSQRLPPPVYSGQQPLQPPVFTHLVQRGYGRQSPSLDGSEGRNQTDDSDMTANLDSGVEFMKRTTTTV